MSISTTTAPTTPRSMRFWPPSRPSPPTDASPRSRAAPGSLPSEEREGDAMTPVLGEIIGPDLLIILAVVCLLFGSSQLPKLARSLGRASKEFREGHAEGEREDDLPKK